MTAPASTENRAPCIDCLQYANWSEKVFRQMRTGGVDAVHATIAYHARFREAVRNLEAWNLRFQQYAELIFPGRSGADVRRAQQTGKTAIFLGFQNPSPIEDDVGLVEVWHDLGVRFMQLSYNNQSLLAGGCYEADDAGVTRMGREVIAEMNRVGMVIDMSHSAERSTLEAIELSHRPIAITHANPHSWHPVPRNHSDTVLEALGQSGGMLGLSLYPHHLRGGSGCTMAAFCAMAAALAEHHGVGMLGIGSDLCQDRDDQTVAWMRNGRWKRHTDDADPPRLPPQPDWFRDNRDFPRLRDGLEQAGFAAADIASLLGGNWLRFFDQSFGPQHDDLQASGG